MKITVLVVVLMLSPASAFASQGADPKAPKGSTAVEAPSSHGSEHSNERAKVSFLNLKNGQTIAPKFTVKFGIAGMKVRPAGEMATGTGHHHLIIDGSSVPKGQVVPADATHLHFGKGQTEVALDLEPGPHKLTMQFADGAHISYGPEVSETIDITVK